MHKKILFFFFSIFLLSLVSAAPPFQTESLEFDSGLVIYTPLQYNLVENQDHTFNFQVFNKTTGLGFTNSTVNCSFMLINDTGDLFYSVSHAGYSAGRFYVTLTAGNFTGGHYNYGIKCVSLSGNVGGMKPTEFLVTESGVDFTEGRSIIALGLLFLLVLLFSISLIGLFRVEDYKGKFVLYWTSHLLSILIFFVGWQLGVEGLLSGTALVGIFRILFFVSTIAVFPMVLLSIAWIVYIHAFNEHFQKLVDKGEDPETAFAIAKKKRGWFNGQ